MTFPLKDICNSYYDTHILFVFIEEIKNGRRNTGKAFNKKQLHQAIYSPIYVV